MEVDTGSVGCDVGWRIMAFELSERGIGVGAANKEFETVGICSTRFQYG